jgi:hypothetical protein
VARAAAANAATAPGVGGSTTPTGTSWLPTVPAARSAPVTTNNVTLNPNITVNPPPGTSTEGVAGMITDRIQEMWRDAHDSLRGGKR